MGLDADAIGVASGDLSVVVTSNALAIVESAEGRRVALAECAAAEYHVVFFQIRQTDGGWRTDVVVVRDGEVVASGGGAGGSIVRRDDVAEGAPYVAGEGRHFITDDFALVQVDGVSADPSVQMWHGDRLVNEAPVAAHGYFVLAAVVPADAEVTIRSASSVS